MGGHRLTSRSRRIDGVVTLENEIRDGLFILFVVLPATSESHCDSAEILMEYREPRWNVYYELACFPLRSIKGGDSKHIFSRGAGTGGAGLGGAEAPY